MKKMMMKTVSLVVAVTFFVSDISYALSPGLLSGELGNPGRAGVEKAVITMAQSHLALSRGPGVAVAEALEECRPSEFIPSPTEYHAKDVKATPMSGSFRPLIDELNARIREGHSWVAALRDVDSIEEGYFEVASAEGDFPIARLEERDGKKVLVVHTAIIQIWEHLRMHNIEYTVVYGLPSGSGGIDDTSIASVIFRRLLAIMTNATDTKREFLDNEIWMWFLGSYCVSNAVRYDNRLFKERLTWLFYDPDAADIRFRNNFIGLPNTGAEERAIAVALRINREFFSRPGVEVPKITVRPELIETYKARMAAAKAVPAAQSLQPRDKAGRFKERPGKSPEDAKKVLALSGLYREDSFTIRDYINAYREVAKAHPELKFEDDISESTARRDIYKNIHSLLKQKYVAILNRKAVNAGKDKNYRFAVPENRRRELGMMAEALKRNGTAAPIEGSLNTLARELFSGGKGPGERGEIVREYTTVALDLPSDTKKRTALETLRSAFIEGGEEGDQDGLVLDAAVEEYGRLASSLSSDAEKLETLPPLEEIFTEQTRSNDEYLLRAPAVRAYARIVSSLSDRDERTARLVALQSLLTTCVVSDAFPQAAAEALAEIQKSLDAPAVSEAAPIKGSLDTLARELFSGGKGPGERGEIVREYTTVALDLPSDTEKRAALEILRRAFIEDGEEGDQDGLVLDAAVEEYGRLASSLSSDAEKLETLPPLEEIFTEQTRSNDEYLLRAPAVRAYARIVSSLSDRDERTARLVALQSLLTTCVVSDAFPQAAAEALAEIQKSLDAPAVSEAAPIKGSLDTLARELFSGGKGPGERGEIVREYTTVALDLPSDTKKRTALETLRSAFIEGGEEGDQDGFVNASAVIAYGRIASSLSNDDAKLGALPPLDALAAEQNPRNDEYLLRGPAAQARDMIIASLSTPQPRDEAVTSLADPVLLLSDTGKMEALETLRRTFIRRGEEGDQDGFVNASAVIAYGRVAVSLSNDEAKLKVLPPLDALAAEQNTYNDEYLLRGPAAQARDMIIASLSSNRPREDEVASLVNPVLLLSDAKKVEALETLRRTFIRRGEEGDQDGFVNASAVIAYGRIASSLSNDDAKLGALPPLDALAAEQNTYNDEYLLRGPAAQARDMIIASLSTTPTSMTVTVEGGIPEVKGLRKTLAFIALGPVGIAAGCAVSAYLGVTGAIALVKTMRRRAEFNTLAIGKGFAKGMGIFFTEWMAAANAPFHYVYKKATNVMGAAYGSIMAPFRTFRPERRLFLTQSSTVLTALTLTGLIMPACGPAIGSVKTCMEVKYEQSPGTIPPIELVDNSPAGINVAIFGEPYDSSSYFEYAEDRYTIDQDGMFKIEHLKGSSLDSGLRCYRETVREDVKQWGPSSSKKPMTVARDMVYPVQLTPSGTIIIGLRGSLNIGKGTYLMIRIASEDGRYVLIPVTGLDSEKERFLVIPVSSIIRYVDPDKVVVLSFHAVGDLEGGWLSARFMPDVPFRPVKMEPQNVNIPMDGTFYSRSSAGPQPDINFYVKEEGKIYMRFNSRDDSRGGIRAREGEAFDLSALDQYLNFGICVEEKGLKEDGNGTFYFELTDIHGVSAMAPLNAKIRVDYSKYRMYSIPKAYFEKKGVDLSKIAAMGLFIPAYGNPQGKQTAELLFSPTAKASVPLEEVPLETVAPEVTTMPEVPAILLPIGAAVIGAAVGIYLGVAACIAMAKTVERVKRDDDIMSLSFGKAYWHLMKIFLQEWIATANAPFYWIYGKISGVIRAIKGEAASVASNVQEESAAGLEEPPHTPAELSSKAETAPVRVDDKDAEGEHPLIKVIREYAAAVYANEGPGSMALSKEDRQAAWESINLLHDSKIEILLEQSMRLPDPLKRAIEDIQRREGEDALKCTPFSTTNLGQVLNRPVPAGVKRIIVTDKRSAADVGAIIAAADPKALHALRALPAIELPANYARMNTKEKTVYMADIVMIAILARLYERDGKTPFVEAALRTMVEKRLYNGDESEETADAFMKGLAESDDEKADPSRIAKRIIDCLGKLIKFSERIARELPLLRELWTAA